MKKITFLFIFLLVVLTTQAVPLPARSHPGTTNAPILKEIKKIMQTIVNWLES